MLMETGPLLDVSELKASGSHKFSGGERREKLAGQLGPLSGHLEGEGREGKRERGFCNLCI